MADVVDDVERFERIVRAFRQFAGAGNYEFKHQTYENGKQSVVVEAWYRPKKVVDGRGK